MTINRSTYYTTYVNHAIRFFLTTPESLTVKEHTTPDVNNWLAVQAVWCDLKPEEQDILRDLYGYRNRPFADCVKQASVNRNMPLGEVWKLVLAVTYRIARARGLVA